MKSKFLSLCVITLLCLPFFFVNAADFRPLVGIPGLENTDIATLGFGDYINALYRLSISIAALLAVIKIIAAGVKYMFSDIVTQKADAKKDIQGALVGLLIIIGAVIILNTVNTDITKSQIDIKPLTNADGTPISDKADFATALEKFKKSLGDGQSLCNEKYKTTCLLERGSDATVTKITCSAGGGVFVEGSKSNLLLGGNILNYCYYDPKEVQRLAEIKTATINKTLCPTNSICEVQLENKNDPENFCYDGSAGDSIIPGESCGTFCTNLNGIPDETTGACVRITSSIDPDINYKITDPAMPEYELPAGPHDGQTVKFKTPLQLDTDKSMIRVIFDGQEVWQGCKTITPNPCPS